MTSKEEAKLKSGLLEFLGGPDKLEEYIQLNTNGERIAYIYNCPMVKSLFKSQALVAKQAEESLKSNKESKRLRELGNAAYKSGRDLKALELYTEALAYADQSANQNEAYALALANRSAVCARLGGRAWAERAVADIDRAMRAGHPTPIKLLDRKVTCLETLGKYSEAVSIIKQMLDDDSSSKDKRKELTNKLETLDVKIDDQAIDESRSVLFSPNLEYPSLSSAIEVKYEANRGRFGVANRDILVGEVMVYESPVDAKLKKCFSNDHCENCLRFCGGFQLPCSRCLESRFCSESCLIEAENSYHKYECASVTKNTSAFFEDFLIKSKGKDGTVEYFKLLLKLVARKPLEFFLNHQQWLTSRNEKFAPSGKMQNGVTQPLTAPEAPQEDDPTRFYGGSYRGLFSLVRHSDQDSAINSFWLMLSAVFHLRTLQVSGYFGASSLKTKETTLTSQEVFLGALLVDLLQLLRYNTHAILENRKEKPLNSNGSMEWKMQMVGTAIYPALALLNHSCDPNITKYFSGSTVIAVASRNIFKGEEICENYFPTFTHMDRKSRQEFLLSHYCFLCQCEPCVQDWMFPEDLKKQGSAMLPWRCSFCKRHFLNEHSTCKNCGLKSPKHASELRQQTQDLMTKFEEIKMNVINITSHDYQSLRHQLDKFEGIYSEISDLIGPNSEEVVKCKAFYSLLLNRTFGNKGQTV